MRCEGCDRDNPPDSRFCEECGGEQRAWCHRCGSDVTPGARFCRSCGARQEAASGAAGEAGRLAVRGGRRDLSVLFCDMVASTEIANRLDAEDFQELVRAYQTACTRAVYRFEGRVAQLLGDGILAYFGFPQAQEDSAERSIRAGLAIVEELRALSPEFQRRLGEGISARVGIHRGMAVVGEMGSGGRREPLAVGESVNLAARLQGAAPENGVVISGSTRSLVQGLFVMRDLGEHALEGADEPVTIYHVLRG